MQLSFRQRLSMLAFVAVLIGLFMAANLTPAHAGAGPLPTYTLGVDVSHHKAAVYGADEAKRGISVIHRGRTVWIRGIDMPGGTTDWITSATLFGQRAGYPKGADDGGQYSISFWNSTVRPGWLVAYVPPCYRATFATVEVELLPTCGSHVCG